MSNSVIINNDKVIAEKSKNLLKRIPTKKNRKVIGHGMNEDELRSNNRLDKFWVQNLNKSQNMPIEDSSIDAGLIVAGWQYLQYPEKVSLELSRIIKSDSLLIIQKFGFL